MTDGAALSTTCDLWERYADGARWEVRIQPAGARPAQRTAAGTSVVFRTVLEVSYVDMAPEHHHGDGARPPGVGRLERIGQR
jgi:hypothetical protein